MTHFGWTEAITRTWYEGTGKGTLEKGIGKEEE